jgi:hypothetical protein
VGNFRHRRGRILFEIFGSLLIASIAAARWEDSHSIRALIAAVPLTLYGLYRIITLFARNPAFGYGEKGVQIGRLFTVDNYRWDQVGEIELTHWKRPYIPFLSWLPKERHYLELQVRAGGLASGSRRIRPEMIELPQGGVKQVIEGFRSAQVAALGQRGAAMARLGANHPIQQAAPASALQAERWQRLGIGAEATEDASAEAPATAPIPQLTVAPRPVFGRKVS